MASLTASCISRRPGDSLRAHLLQQRITNLTPLEARLLEARGVTEAYPSLPELTERRLQDLPKAAKRLYAASKSQEQIVVVADYDCDGATSCSVMVSAMRALGARIDYVVPDRLIHGYGISPSVVDLARDAYPAVRLLVTVDNGILGHAGIAYANTLGIDTVVTDHHLPGATLPEACAVVDPSRADCDSGLAELAGVGVALWLVLAVKALAARAGEPTPKFSYLLAYVALGTVADLVPLHAANRHLVRCGLQVIRSGAGPIGIQALIREAGLTPAYLTTADISFGLAPRINAAGRIASMRAGIDLLLSTNKREATALAKELSLTNETRKRMQKGALAQAGAGTLAAPKMDATDRHALVAASPDWHPGIIGLVASKLKEEHYLPSFVFSTSGGVVKGSGRSIAGFHLKDALEELARRAPDVLLQFGGHAMAAGCTLTGPEAIPRFEQAFEAIAAERLLPEHLRRVVHSDGPVPELDEHTAERLLRHPWGQHFEAPAFDDEVTVTHIQPLGQTGEHWKIRAALSGRNEELGVVLFNQDAPEPGATARLLLQPTLNTWRDKTSLQWLGTVLH